MPVWSRTSPPLYEPNAILTRYGWEHPVTRELLIPIFDPAIGPGKNIRQRITGNARIIKALSQGQIGISRIIERTTIVVHNKISGQARIKIGCQIPVNTGINPSW